MRRLLVLAALPLSLAAPAGAIALTVSSSPSSDQQVIQVPTAPTPASGDKSTAGSNTKPVELFDGESVPFDGACADSRGLDDHKGEALAAANLIPARKQTVLDARRDFEQFLKKHPERTLSDADFSRYRALKAPYQAAMSAYNQQIDDFNQLIDVYNADLDACKTS